MNIMSASRLLTPKRHVYTSALRGPALWLAGLDILTIAALEALRNAGITDHRSSTLGAIFCLGLLLVIMLWTGVEGDRRVIITDDSIEVRNWFRRRKLTWKEIGGRTMRRSSPGDEAGQYVILPANKAKKPLTLPVLTGTDGYFFAFIRSIPKVRR